MFGNFPWGSKLKFIIGIGAKYLGNFITGRLARNFPWGKLKKKKKKKCLKLSKT